MKPEDTVKLKELMKRIDLYIMACEDEIMVELTEKRTQSFVARKFAELREKIMKEYAKTLSGAL